MGLILNNKIQALMKGYPTISDKYDVAGGVIKAANDPVDFGTALFFYADGVYKTVAASAAVTSEKFAGIAMATNVKLVTTYPGASEQAKYLAGEAVNCMFRGGIAVAVNSTVYTEITAGAKAYVGAGGAFTTDNTNAIEIGMFTGAKEQQGTAYLAEIVLK